MTSVDPTASEQAMLPDFSKTRGAGALRSGRLWMVGAALFGVAMISGSALELWIAATILKLLETYRYGHVPAELLPQGAEAIDDIYGLTSVGGTFGLIVSLFVSMYYARAAQKYIGAAGYAYSFFWTVATLFVPIANLFRPWLGLAEIRRVAYMGAATGDAASAWAPGAPASFATICLASWFILGGLILRVIAAALPPIQNISADNAIDMFSTYAKFHIYYVCYALGLTALITGYCYTTLKETERFLFQSKTLESF